MSLMAVMREWPTGWKDEPIERETARGPDSKEGNDG